MKRFILVVVAASVFAAGCEDKNKKGPALDIVVGKACSDFLSEPENAFPKYSNARSILIKGNVSLNASEGGQHFVVAAIPLDDKKKDTCGVKLLFDTADEYSKVVEAGTYRLSCKFKTAKYMGSGVFMVAFEHCKRRDR